MPEGPAPAAGPALSEAEEPLLLDSAFRQVGTSLRRALRAILTTHQGFATFALLLFLGAILAVLVTGWWRGAPFGVDQALGMLIVGYGALGGLVLFLVSLLVLHGVTVGMARMLRPRAVPRRHTPMGEKLFHLITFLASVWTGYTSYYGFQIVFFSPDEGWRYWAVPGLAGVIGATFVYTFWTTLLERMEMANVWQKLVLLLIIAPVGSSIIFGMSTATSVLGVGGDAAITYHLRVSVDALQRSLNEIRQVRDGEFDQLVPIARQISSRFERLATQEETQGTLTSAAGSGSVSVYLHDLSQVATSIADHLEASHREEITEIAAINDTLRRLRESLADRGRAFRAQYETLIRDLNAVQGRIGGVVASSPTDYFRFQIGTMREIRPLTADSVNRLFAASQQTVVANLQNEKNATLDEIMVTLNSMATHNTLSVPPFAPMHDLEAILVYWRQIWLSWAIAIATDMGPLLWILVAAVMPTGAYLVTVHDEERKAGFNFLDDDGEI
ncbi:hypothetical protein [Pararhodospirillum oryzae]|nr:hypothetical protein [Pararhodospirillum oryzae]